MDNANDFNGLNSGYVVELYERYLKDPSAVDPATRAAFKNWIPPYPQAPGSAAPVQGQADIARVVAVANLAQSIRTFGHLAAPLDPLGSPPKGDPSLELATHGLTESDLAQMPAAAVGGPSAQGVANALEAIQSLRRAYSSRSGFDYGHITIPEERDWLYNAAECGVFRPPEHPVDEARLLDRLTQVEAFEQFLHRFFPGKTRFSIEGLDILVPMLDEILDSAIDAGICMMMIGMAHRGRLNVLAHVISRPYGEILAEFKDPTRNYHTLSELGYSGDVKYHKGASRSVAGSGAGEEGIKIVLRLPPNPSHLEHVNPVVVGMARAADSGTNKAGPPVFYPSASLPILIHGDAAFPGEGIVAETLNLSRLPGYRVAGSIHIIANNQIGYTTLPEQGRSTQYASDLARGFEIPIVHVNADDPIACLEAARTAFAYRETFHKDFLIDLVGYRRYGHNEGDEPSFTQPELYQKIEQHPSLRKQWAGRLVERGEVPPDRPDAMMQERMQALQREMDQLKPDEALPMPDIRRLSAEETNHVVTRVALPELKALNDALLSVPEGFSLNRKLERAMQKRRTALDDPDARTVEWATAEELALAAILADGTPIRFTGQDAERGTFSQRHAVFHSTSSGGEMTIPLQNLPQARASAEIRNSPLSENAALGFEYGYNIQNPGCLVLWEGQYGDFINSAQAIVDEFIVSGLSKWAQKPSLVLLLPHGYEGQGPDHSSGRMERFLQLATDQSLRAANATTAAQYFHLLRTQAALLRQFPLPLVIFTPKSLLRHPAVASSPRELAEGRWMPVLDDPAGNQNRDAVLRLALCSGKVAIDLLESPLRKEHPEIAIARLEQLSPFPEEDLRALIESYPHLEEIAWVQEEPENMGAYLFVRSRLPAVTRNLPLYYIGRAASASPAEGSFAWHSLNQQALVRQAFSRESVVEQSTAILYKE